ncbi:hypothetical protein [Paenibacillus sp. 1P07SE]|uniref:hypothetical protein n=1 Tax=Paenibacillus sp. 1P07SE TaxID=3132209 RepID=UPI0039A5AC84
MELEEIYRNHANSVYRYLLRLTHDEDLAEELTEETIAGRYIPSTRITAAAR